MLVEPELPRRMPDRDAELIWRAQCMRYATVFIAALAVTEAITIPDQTRQVRILNVFMDSVFNYSLTLDKEDGYTYAATVYRPNGKARRIALDPCGESGLKFKGKLSDSPQVNAGRVKQLYDASLLTIVDRITRS